MPLLRDDAQNDICQAIITRLTTGAIIAAPLLRVYEGATMIAECAIGSFSTPVNGFSTATVADDTGVTETPETYEIIGRDNTVKISGGIAELPYSLIDGTFKVLGGLRISSPAFQLQNDEMGFVTEGAAFQPIIEVTGTPTILWTFADGTTSDSATPTSVTYGSAGVRIAKLKVTPWSALIGINFGYDGSDQGYASTETPILNATKDHANQNVGEIINFHLARNSLLYICAERNSPLKFLDCTGFANLRKIEMYNSALVKILLTGTENLRRLCVEGSPITGVLPLSESLQLADLRAGRLAVTGFDWADETYPNLWHFCTVDNPQLQENHPDLEMFPALGDFWVANNNQSGGLTLPHNINCEADGNQYTALVVKSTQYINNNCYIPNSNISSVDLSEMTALMNLNLTNNNLSQSQIDYILVEMNTKNPSRTNMNIRLSGNSAPSATGIAARDAMVARGCTVVADEPATVQLSTPTFNPAAGTYTSAQTVTISYDAASQNRYYRIDGGSWQNYTSAITVSASQLIEAYSSASGYIDSITGSASYTINIQTPQLATPAFNPAGGTYNSTQTITISFDAASTSRYYRIDGGSWQAYTTAITVLTSQLVETYSTASGYTNSAVGSASYIINAQTGTVIYGVVGGTYADSQSVSLTPVNNEDTVYYRFSATAAWCRYTTGAPLALHQNCTLYTYASSASGTINSQSYVITAIPTNGILWCQQKDEQAIDFVLTNGAVTDVTITWWDGSQRVETITGTGGGMYYYKVGAGTTQVRTNRIVFSNPSAVLIIGRLRDTCSKVLVDWQAFVNCYRLSIYALPILDTNLLGSTALYSLYFDALSSMSTTTFDRIMAELDACSSYGSSGKSVVGGGQHTSAANAVAAALTTKGWGGFSQV